MEQIERDSTDYFKLETQEEKIRDALLKYLKGETKLLPDNLFNGSENLTDIDLSGCQITELKPNMFHGLTTISKINFSNNRIKTIPPDFFSGLEEINQINFSNNQIQEIPGTLFNGLKNIDRVNFSKNKINKLPEQLTNWNNEKDEYDFEAIAGINFSYNEIATIPSTLFNGIVSIHGINFSFNKISEIPEDLFKSVESLWEMNLSNNQIKSVPDKLFANVKEAKGINFADNLIKHVSIDLFANIDLINDINFSNNYISSLSLEILNNSSLSIDFRNNFKIDNVSSFFDRFFYVITEEINDPDENEQQRLKKLEMYKYNLKESLLIIFLNNKQNKVEEICNSFNEKIAKLEQDDSPILLDFLVSLNDIKDSFLFDLENYVSTLVKQNDLCNKDFKISSPESIKYLCERNNIGLFKVFLPVRNIGDKNDPSDYNKYVKNPNEFYSNINFIQCMDIAIENQSEEIAVYIMCIVNQMLIEDSDKLLDKEENFSKLKVKLHDEYISKFISLELNWWNAIEAIFNICDIYRISLIKFLNKI